MSIPFRRVVIIGVGLIGGSIAAALKQLDEAPEVYGIGPREDTLKTALAAGALDDYAVSDDPKADGWLAPGASDLVIIATPVSAAREWFERLEACRYDGIITDVASTKTVITRIADEVLSDPTRYLPGHPMAGSEVNGFSGARADLFQGAYWILCPEQDTQDEVFLKLHETFSALGARIISISRDQHDSAVAIISHVPHMVASSLVRLWGNHADERKELLRLAAGGFKDTTRIAAGSPELWCGIAMDNSEAIADGMRELRGILQQFEDAIRDHDEETLTKLLAESTELRRNLPAKWIPESAKLTCVRIPMSNRSGVIAEVTGFAGHAACNIQSIDIDHINEDTAVLELILTDEGDMGKLGAELINGGYDFSFRALSE
ncbi:MAG: prephenate dehydrogenase/arogenate dehydrogenase family protein [Coriobacteriales bacterium]